MLFSQYGFYRGPSFKSLYLFVLVPVLVLSIDNQMLAIESLCLEHVALGQGSVRNVLIFVSTLMLASSLHHVLAAPACDDGQEIHSRALSQVWRVSDMALMAEVSEEFWVVRSSSAVGSTRMPF
jgi:hypothetical protein